jgi:hypothetical protein
MNLLYLLFLLLFYKIRQWSLTFIFIAFTLMIIFKELNGENIIEI